MSITVELQRLGDSARRLNADSDSLNEAIKRIDALLGQLNVGMEYVHPRPLEERSVVDESGKRVIELIYGGYLKVDRGYHLAIRTTKVLESRLQLATQTPGTTTALLHAPRQLRFAAVDILPELVSGLAAQVDAMVAAMRRRQHTANSLLRNLEAVAASLDSTSGEARRPAGAPVRNGPRPGPKHGPGKRETPVVRDGRRKTAPIGSGALRRLQDDPH